MPGSGDCVWNGCICAQATAGEGVRVPWVTSHTGARWASTLEITTSSRGPGSTGLIRVLSQSISRPGWSGRASCPCVRVLWASELCWGETPLGTAVWRVAGGHAGCPMGECRSEWTLVHEALPVVCLPCLTPVSAVIAQTRRKQNSISCSPFCFLAEQSQSILFSLNQP